VATRTEVLLVDDLDGETPAGATVKFALEDAEYEIDLTDENAEAMREALSRYVKAARKVPPSRGRRSVQPGKPAYSGYDRPLSARGLQGGVSTFPRVAGSRPASSSSTEPPAIDTVTA
jgi:hypothetical protein